MKANQFKRPISWLLAFVMVLSLCPTVAFAGDTLPYTGESALGENEPTSHGYRAEDLLTWDPATDPDAELLRARVPLQNRIAAVAATQANPALNPEVEYLTLAGDYGNAFFGGTSYTNEFSEYAFNFWQYIDYYAPWHGQTTATTPFELWDSEGERKGTSNWEMRAFEFGMMNLPNAAYTNAAHKNGVLSLGCIFLPRAYQSWRTLIQRDENGNFPYGEKLIEITEYYGFDGWFVNLEGSDSPGGEAKTELAAFLKSLRDAGLYVQYYNAGGSIDQEMMDAGAADSFFKDYGWSTNGAVSEVEKYGIAAVHGGFEAGGARWSGSGQGNYSKLWKDGQVVCSIATLGTDFVHAGIDEDFGNHLDLRRETDDFQWMSAVRERMWFTGGSGNPSKTGDEQKVANAEVGVSTNRMPGISSLVTERSVVSGDTFVTNFNTGHGLVYSIDGAVSNSHEWANLNIQDILPTWQFWFETEGTELKAEYDYGTTYKKALTGSWNAGEKVGEFTYGEFGFDLVDPWKGGSSLAVYGKVDADNFMHLYKTDLDVTEGSKVTITYKKTSSDTVAMSLGVVFADSINAEDNSYTVTDLALSNVTELANGWNQATVDLSAYAGQSIAVLGLNFKGASDDYQMHIGEIAYTSGRDVTPAAPEGLTIAKAYDTNEMVVTWTLGDYDSVKQYNVYAVINGVEQYMGGIYDEIFYIKNLYDAQGEVTISVRAVGADGSESEAATAVYDYNKAVTGLSVTPADGSLTVAFTPADAAAATDVSVYVPATGETYTATAAAGETSLVVTVPAGAGADGKEYEMTVTPAGGSAKAYDGKLDDSYCVPYDGPMTGHKLTSPVACTDWYKLALDYVTTSGQADSTEYTRGKKSHGELNNDWSRFQNLPDDIMILNVTLTDYAGNVSETVTYNFVDGEPVIPEVFDRVVHLDAGRKYFSPENIKAMIDVMAEAGFNQLDLYFSDNQGFRFALDDMTLTTEYGTYDLTPALGDGYSDGSKFPDGTGKYLTQSEMDGIIEYATSKGVEIVGSINVPGHMGAILEEFPSLRYTGSNSSIDLSNEEAKAFAKAFVKKYAEYFASKGCAHFCFGADEWANDLGSMGFAVLYNSGEYHEHFVPFFNEVAAIVKETGMTPRAFNDGLYYNNDTTVSMDSDVEVYYWSSGWPGYDLASAATLDRMGNPLINTHQGYYWVLGNKDWQLSAENAAKFDYTLFEGGTKIYSPDGAMFAIWCDNGAADGADDGAGVVEAVTPVIQAFGATLPETKSTVPVLDASYFPDPALLAAVMEQAGPYVTDLADFEGVLDVSNSSLTDLTGIDQLPGLTGLKLKNTKLTRITSDMIPGTVQTLDLTDCKELVYVELNQHPNLVVTLTGCSAMVSLYLEGTQMTELDISSMKVLENLVITGSQISTLKAASSYPNAYYFNWANSKLDLSDSSREGKLKNVLTNHFATAQLEDKIDPAESDLAVFPYSWSGTFSLDMGTTQLITKLVWENYYADYTWGLDYGLNGGILYGSEDGETYTEILSFSGTSARNITLTLPENTRARYLRLEVTEGYGYCDDIHVLGHGVAPKGFVYTGQQPVILRDEMDNVIYERDGAQYQLLDLLAENWATARTVSGTKASHLEGADWIDQDYLTRETTVPSGVKVVITGEDGTEYVPSNIPAPDLGTLDEDTDLGDTTSVLNQSGQYSGEYSYMIFDGDASTKWCTSGQSGWVGFALAESKVIGKYYIEHAGNAELPTYNTKSWRLQVLDPNGAITTEDFLAMSATDQRNAFRDNSNWLSIDTVTENSDSSNIRQIAEENRAEAQIYRLYVDQSVQGTSGIAVRIYELDLYGFTGHLLTNANGVFIADNIGTWNVSFVKGGNEIANATVRVRLSDQDLVDLSEAVEAAKSDAEAAAEAAEAAQTAAEAAQAAAEAARAEAEAAQAAAEAAAAEAGENREAAEEAQRKAEEAQAKAEAAEAAAEAAQAKAEEAQAAAEEAQAAAENAAAAAEESNRQAAEEAVKAAAEAAAAAASAEAAAASELAAAEAAAEAANSAAAAAEAMVNAQAAQAAAEEAARIAEAAQAKAEEAKALAEEAANSSAEDREAAEKAALEAAEAQAAAEAAQKAAEEAKSAAEAARDAAAQSNIEAAASAALAAQYAAEVAQAHADIVAMKAEIIEYLADAQKAAEAAEEAQRKAEEAALAAAKYYALIELSQTDLDGLTPEQTAAVEEILAATRTKLDEAKTPAEVEAILADAKAAIEEAKHLLCTADVFTDVLTDTWYHDSVDFVVRNGYMNGMSDSVFGLTSNLNRAQLVTILYRIAGSPDVEGKPHSFTDVKKNSFYEDAVAWAVSEGIVNGVTDTTFAPDRDITRSEIAVILYRYSGRPTVEANHLAEFLDADTVPNFAVEAMNWAVDAGLINGVPTADGNELQPLANAIRAQIAVIITRYLTN